MATFPSDGEDGGLFSPEETKQLLAIQQSDVWLALVDALCFRREQLFSESPETTELLWKNRGQIEEIQALLQRGPLLVVHYQRFMRSQEPATSTPRPPATKARVDETPEL